MSNEEQVERALDAHERIVGLRGIPRCICGWTGTLEGGAGGFRTHRIEAIAKELASDGIERGPLTVLTPAAEAGNTALAEAWQEGVTCALNHAIRNDDGITLRLEHLDGSQWINPFSDPSHQPTPRVVTTVEELTPDMVLRDANGFVCQTFLAGDFMMVARAMGDTTYSDSDASLFPAIVVNDPALISEVRRLCRKAMTQKLTDGERTQGEMGLAYDINEVLASAFAGEANTTPRVVTTVDGHPRQKTYAKVLDKNLDGWPVNVGNDVPGENVVVGHWEFHEDADYAARKVNEILTIGRTPPPRVVTTVEEARQMCRDGLGDTPVLLNGYSLDFLARVLLRGSDSDYPLTVLTPEPGPGTTALVVAEIARWLTSEGMDDVAEAILDRYDTKDGV